MLFTGLLYIFKYIEEAKYCKRNDYFHLEIKITGYFINERNQ